MPHCRSMAARTRTQAREALSCCLVTWRADIAPTVDEKMAGEGTKVAVLEESCQTWGFQKKPLPALDGTVRPVEAPSNPQSLLQAKLDFLKRLLSGM